MAQEEKKPIEAIAASPVPVKGKIISDRYADITLRFVEEHGHDVEPLTPGKENKLLWKLYVHLLILLVVINLMLFVSHA